MLLSVMRPELNIVMPWGHGNCLVGQEQNGVAYHRSERIIPVKGVLKVITVHSSHKDCVGIKVRDGLADKEGMVGTGTVLVGQIRVRFRESGKVCSCSADTSDDTTGCPTDPSFEVLVSYQQVGILALLSDGFPSERCQLVRYVQLVEQQFAHAEVVQHRAHVLRVFPSLVGSQQGNEEPFYIRLGAVVVLKRGGVLVVQQLVHEGEQASLRRGCFRGGLGLGLLVALGVPSFFFLLL